MTLAELFNRDVRVEWHEAVALVRAILAAAPEGSPDSDCVPGFDQVELLASGHVRLLGTSHAPDPVERLGELLVVLLGRGDPPVQLRLAMSQPHETVHDYSEALAFFERPDRAAVLQELYSRATAALPLPAPDAFAAPLHPVAAERSAKESKDPEAARSRRHALLYGAAVLALVAVVAAATLFARRSENPAQAVSGLTTKVSKGIGGVTASVGSAVSAIGQRVGLGPAAPAAAPPAESPKPPETRVTTSRGGRTGRAPSHDARDLQGAKLSAFDLSASVNETPRGSGQGPIAAVITSDESHVSGTDSANDATYSSSSPGVSPPVGVRPQLPKELPPGVDAAKLTRIELLILPDGTVDSVKLIGAPQTVHDWMLLSAVKAWQFHPAMKAGVPVRYRKTIWVAR